MKRTTELRIIKKYQNRRLYDTATSTYIVLSDIKQMIVEGNTVQVTDVKTEADVTRSVLLQIILEEEVNGQPLFTNDFMFQIIRFYGKAFQSSISPFLEQSLDVFKQIQKNFYGQIKEVYGKDKLPAGVNLWNDFMLSQGPQMQTAISNYLKTNTNSFLQVQEQLKQQTETLMSYMQFPFSKKAKNG